MRTRNPRPARPPALFGSSQAPCALAVVACAMVTGCSSPSSRHSSGAASDGGNVDVTFQIGVTAKAGTEAFVCQFAALPSTLGPRAFMLQGSQEATPGTHHLAVYATDLSSLPPNAGQATDCFPDNQTDNALSHARGVIYAAQVPNGVLGFAPGVGLRVTAGQVVLLNYHYINATQTDVNASAKTTLTITPDGAGITQSAAFIFWTDPYIAVPAGAQAHAQMRCGVPNDVTVTQAVSHYHKRGVSFAAYIDPARDQHGTTPFYTSDNWEDPEVLIKDIQIPGGSAIRYQCDYDNRAGSADFFEGPSATTNEMCMFEASYYPDQGDAVNSCFLGADMFGTGSTDCRDTAACLIKCPPNPSPLAVGAPYPPCTQQCMVNSCPTVSANLPPLLTCMQQNCADACGLSSDGGAPALDGGVAGSGDEQADPCAACGTTRCPMETSACEQQACP